ncbi:bifunctional 2-polyprenyl-6-hydroxyphenol methylase/3-demethylubiquinol 3-O-methyltransferase UbiG [Bosea sp. (in: a-proteobacteria)]|uniref:class I SAM-dependent methyltransferase n=1 Tax=Bosea sp. (in: a-proteobacteria) TaxID=1871050 RepID=UPI00262F26B0|nr:class I SAM-dependent methyltransferase [Bosea sp. (in: a-proteobacteria)]MCO5093491.1 class I SAM-dependent methyltransferase [Bosea sp. (in: a-proteobacteria)]
MTQNIYDDETFFAGYSRLPRSIHGLDGAPEWPVLRGMLPQLAGRKVLDLGCGFGWFCRFAAGEGAASVLGVDVSEKMLERAQRETDDSRVSYERADLERYTPPADAFDLAYSSLAFHYIEDLAGLFGQVHAALKPGGALVCSVEHPIMTAPTRQEWLTDADGRAAWPVNGYLDEGRRVSNWLTEGVVKRHRAVATHLDLLLGAGFRLDRLVEWAPSPEQVTAEPAWTRERERPFFLLIAAARS